MQETDANSGLDTSPRFVTEFDKMECDESVDHANCDSSLHEQRSEDPVQIEPREDLLEIIDVDDSIAQDDEREKLGVKPYKCSISSPACATGASITENFRTQTGKKQFQCGECDHVSAQRGGLTRHMRTHTGEKPFQCPVCEYCTAPEGSLRDHLTRRHKIKNTHKCVDCDLCFAKFSSLLKHKKMHAKAKLVKRTVCDFDTVTSEHLEILNKTQKMECVESTDPANSDSSLPEQRSEDPVGIRPPEDLLEITDLDDTTAQDDEREKLGVKPYKCNISSPACATSASSPRFVTEFDKIECDESTDPANCDSSLHEQRSEDPVGMGPPEDVLEIIDVDDTFAQDDGREKLGMKPYKCNISSPACATSASITEHLRTHTGKKQFQCSECDHVSANRGALTIHIRKHTGERPFKCSVCEYASAYVGCLRQHLTRQHQIKKTHKCVDCDYACAKSSTLRKHKKTHTRAKLVKRTACDFGTVTSEHLEISNKMQKMEYDESTDPANCDSSLPEQRSEDPVGIEPVADLLEIIDHEDTTAQDDEQKKLGVEPYKCNISSPACATRASITAHLRTPTGMKLFHCGECDYVSAKRGALTIHIRKHTGERPFKCSVCEYASAYVGCLRQHLTRQHQIKKTHKCVDCDYACVKSSTLRKHKKTHTRAKLAKRTVCDIATVTSQHLQIPNKAHIKPKPIHICPVCEYTCTKKFILKNHMINHIRVKVSQCGQCDYSSSNRADFIRHMRIHSPVKPFQCLVCEYACTNRSSLQLHIKTHIDEFKCDLCEYSTTTLEQLVVHKGTHYEQEPFTCQDCDYTCTEASTLEEHTRTHTERNIFKCSYCNLYSTSTLKHLEIHIVKCVPYRCKLCPYGATRCRDLKEHMRVHTGIEPLKCTFCNYTTNYRTNLDRHIRVHTGEKPFKCDFCDYARGDKAGLLMHMLTHKGAKPYKCKLCDYAGVSSHSLRRHKATHKGKKNLLCNICNYATAQRVQLARHMTSHTGLRPFQCSFCSYAGAVKCDLTRHMQTHPKETSSKQTILSKLITNIAGESRPSASFVTSAEDLQLTTPVGEDCTPVQNTLKKCKFIVTSIMNNQDDMDNIIEDHPANQVEEEVSMDEIRQTMNQSDGVRDEFPKDKEVAEKGTEVSQIRNVTEDYICDIHDTNVVDSRCDVMVDITKVKAEVTTDEITPTMNHSDGVRDELLKDKEVAEKGTEVSQIRNVTEDYIRDIHDTNVVDSRCDVKVDITKVKAEVTTDEITPTMNQSDGVRYELPKNSEMAEKCNLQQRTKTHGEETLFNSHSEQTPFTCQDSGTIPASMQLQMHTTTHVQYFKCKFCAYASTRSGCLKHHMRVHSVEKPFKCTICDYASQYRSSLTQHIRTHSGEKPFKCDVCDYSGTQKSNLEMHMLTHAVEKLYKCKLCDYVSSFRNTLVCHEVTHTVAQQFLCNICNYATAQRSKLTRHMRSHTGQKPYQCSLCSYAGAEKSYLTRHMRTHSKEKPSKQTILSKLITNMAGESSPSASFVTSAEDLQLTTAVEEDCTPVQNTLKKCKFIVTSITNKQDDMYIIVDHPANQVEGEGSMDETRQTMNQSDRVRDELPKSKAVAEKCKELSPPIRNVTEADIRDIHAINVVDNRCDVMVDITKVKAELTTDEIAPTMNQSDGLMYEIIKVNEEIQKWEQELILEVWQKMEALAAVDALQKELEEREKLWMEEKGKLEDRIHELENEKTDIRTLLF